VLIRVRAWLQPHTDSNPVYKVVMSSQAALQKKRPGPAPTGQGKVVALRLHRELLDPLDQWIIDQPDPKPNRSDAIRYFLRAALIGSDDKG
jgi:hypothetical protein